MRFKAWFLLAVLAVAPKLHAEEPRAPSPESAEPNAAGALPAELTLETTAPLDNSTDNASQLVVRVLLKGCNEFTEEEVERVLSAELAVDSSHSESVHEPTWVIVQCAGSKVVVEVHDPLSRKIVQRRFDFVSPKTQARGRLVALAAAELVLASWAELAVLPSLRVKPEGPEPSARQRSQARKRVETPRSVGTMLLGTDPSVARESRGPAGERIVYGDYAWERLPGRLASRVLALTSLRKFPGARGALVGGGVRLGSDALPLHGWAADALVESGSINSVHVENWTLGGMLYFVRELREGIVARAGAGLRAGVLRTWDESPKYRSSSPVFWGWPLVALAGSARIGSLVLELASEAGYATLPSGPGRSDSSRGVWVNAQFGFGISL